MEQVIKNLTKTKDNVLKLIQTDNIWIKKQSKLQDFVFQCIKEQKNL